MGLIQFLEGFIRFLNDAVVPLLMAIAFLVFVVNIVRFFIIDSAEEEGRRKAKDLALYGILAFVIIVSIWGIVNLFANDLFPRSKEPIRPDYFNQGAPRGGSAPGLSFPMGFREDLDGDTDATENSEGAFGDEL